MDEHKLFLFQFEKGKERINRIYGNNRAKIYENQICDCISQEINGPAYRRHSIEETADGLERGTLEILGFFKLKGIKLNKGPYKELIGNAFSIKANNSGKYEVLSNRLNYFDEEKQTRG